MTMQMPEVLIIDGATYETGAEPLDRLLDDNGISFGMIHTGCFRGYLGTWEIRDNRLYLVDVRRDRSDPPDGNTGGNDRVRWQVLRAAVSIVFPIFAHWYTGYLRVPTGRQVAVCHSWFPWHASERVLTIEAGVVRRDRNVDTGAMLRRWLTRNPSMQSALAGGEAAYSERSGLMLLMTDPA